MGALELAHRSKDLAPNPKTGFAGVAGLLPPNAEVALLLKLKPPAGVCADPKGVDWPAVPMLTG
ncbi:hypothetical protein HF325_003674 [Metschnikowia pulcherrima]|uniref:Uncharacterized protein n=1 Tax=Metschnikowia pulcherrima TaxID=27326 RepID=A0A8H7GS83_9ASCO|nr:hypothetical protein HF325_003674 [Metschnikowia pulcherrima]